MASINPYLNFNGNTEKAFNFYRTVFGGDFQALQRFKDLPSDIPSPESEGNKLSHVSLAIGNGTMLMGSDRPSAFGPATIGDNVHISIQSESETDARTLFTSLSAGGKVTMPLEKAFWGALFGMVTDRFGIQWMVTYNY